MSKFRTGLVRQGGGSIVGLGLLLMPLACASTHPASPPAVAVPAPPVAGAPPAAVPPAAVTSNVAIAAPPPQAAAPAAMAPATLATGVAPTTTASASPAAAAPPTGTPAAAALPSLPTTAPAAAAAPPATPPAPVAPPIINIVDEKPFVPAAAAHGAASTAAPTTTTTSRSTHHSKHPATTHANAHHRPRHDHPDPRVIVEVTGVQGNAQQVEVQRQARAKGYGAIRGCYEEGLRRNQHLGGKVAFDLVLGTDGAVGDAQKKSSSLNDDSVNQCVIRETAHLALFAAENAGATVSFAVTLSPGDDPVVVPHAAPRADKLRETLRGKWSGVEVCYKQGLDRKRDIGGRMEIRFKVKSSGEVLDAAEAETTHFADADVSRCVLGVLKGAKFTRVPGHRDATFVYALHLEAIPAGQAQATLATTAPAPADDAEERPPVDPPPARPRRRRAAH